LTAQDIRRRAPCSGKAAPPGDGVRFPARKGKADWLRKFFFAISFRATYIKMYISPRTGKGAGGEGGQLIR